MLALRRHNVDKISHSFHSGDSSQCASNAFILGVMNVHRHSLTLAETR